MLLMNKRSQIRSTSYKRSSQISKPKVIMNDLQLDCGYPQDILTVCNSRLPHNFIQKNKQNLKNFFKDRIPQNQLYQRLQKTQNIHFDSQRVFEIKAQQIQLKSQTKIKLDDSFLQNHCQHKNMKNKKIEKVNEIFSVNDKTIEFKNKFQSLHRNKLYTYNKDNHLKGTQCFMEKRSKIPKKQAYDKVFGLDSTFQCYSMPVTPNGKKKDRMIKNQDKKNKTFSSHMRPKQKQENLCNLLQKMDDFKNKFKTVKIDYKDEENKQFLSVDAQKDQKTSSVNNQHQSDQKNKVLSLVQNIREYYRQQAILQNRPKIVCFEDLQKLDSKFYHQLNNHKKGRIEKRLIELYRHSLPETNEMINSKVKHQFPELNITFVDPKNIQQKSDTFSLTDNQAQQAFQRPVASRKNKLSIKERFRKLGIHLAKAYLQSKFYQVNPKYFYPAFWQQRQPYQMEGSYAFFKAIKLNDIECVKSFINISIHYLYEEDTHGRTPLIYACLHNHQEIVAYFLELGCNVDKICGKKRTALFYALQNKNLHISQLLLQYGASPWSGDSYSYPKTIKQLKDISFQILFSNAKKIYLGVRLQIGSRKRHQFWNKNKKRITFSEKINF